MTGRGVSDEELRMKMAALQDLALVVPEWQRKKVLQAMEAGFLDALYHVRMSWDKKWEAVMEFRKAWTEAEE